MKNCGQFRGRVCSKRNRSLASVSPNVKDVRLACMARYRLSDAARNQTNHAVHLRMFKFRHLQSWLPTGGLSTQFPHTNDLRHHAQRLMPRKFEGLEAAMLLFCGSYGFLVSVLILQAALQPMLLSFALVALGLLRWRRPARSKLQWSVDALFAVVILAGLFSDSRTGGGAGPYLFLVLLLAVTFPLLMEASNAILFTGLLLTVYFAFGRGAAWSVPPTLFALRGVLVAGMCLLSARFGMVLRRAEDSVEQMRCDLESGAYNEHGWLHYGHRALRECIAQAKPLSLVYLSMPPDWTRQIIETKRMFNVNPQALRQLRAQALSEIAQNITMALSSRCIVGRDANGDWVLLMPGYTSKLALQRLEMNFGRPLQINFGPRSDEMFVSFMPCVVQVEVQENLQDTHTRAADIWNRGVHSGAID
jgi:hypothetical protein